MASGHSPREALLIEEAKEPTPPPKKWWQQPRKIALITAAVLAIALVVGVVVSIHVSTRNRANQRGPFGSRMRGNLVFEQDFQALRSLDTSLWNPARTLADEHDSFQYFTDDPSALYVNATDHSLRLRPGLFSELPALRTMPDESPFLAEEVMLGTCKPYPQCATFRVPDCTSATNEGGACAATGGASSSLGPAIVKPITSAKIDTAGKFDFTYGRLEARVRLPAGDWLWPSIRLKPRGRAYGAWPLSGEIDLVESRGNSPAFRMSGQPAGRDIATSTVHYGENQWWHAQASVRAPGAAQAEAARKPIPDFSTQFVTFGLWWNESSMYTYVLDERPGFLPVEQRVLDLTPKMSGGFFLGELGRGGPMPPSMRESRELHPLPPAAPNPYKRGPRNAPFDKPFYLEISVAAGDLSHGCPDPQYFGPTSPWCRPCQPGAQPAPHAGHAGPATDSKCGPPQTEFWSHRGEWLPSWQTARDHDRNSLAIEWIRVWQ